MAVEHDFKRYPELTNNQLEELRFDSPHHQITEDFRAVVERVVDGDTIRITHPQRDFVFPLRLTSVDAPELSEGGGVTKEWLKQRIEGKTIEVEIDSNNRVGKYGRLLGRVISGGIDVNEEMLNLGLVSVFGFKNEGQPDPVDKIFSTRQWF